MKYHTISFRSLFYSGAVVANAQAIYRAMLIRSTDRKYCQYKHYVVIGLDHRLSCAKATTKD